MLNTSIPRVKRAIADAGVPVVARGGRVEVPLASFDQLVRHLGTVPDISELSREQAKVLAVLNHRPMGMLSARSVAAAAGISPTSATKALAKLEEAGYVSHATEALLEGEVVKRPVWRLIRRGEPWQRVAPRVRQVVLPAPKAPVARHERHVPRRFGHLFWNADVRGLNLDRDGRYVAGRILASSDAQALAWMARTLPSKDIIAASKARGMSAQVRAMARNLASR